MKFCSDKISTPYWFSLPRFLFSKRKREVFFVLLFCKWLEKDRCELGLVIHWFSLPPFLFSKRKGEVFFVLLSFFQWDEDAAKENMS